MRNTSPWVCLLIGSCRRGIDVSDRATTVVVIATEVVISSPPPGAVGGFRLRCNIRKRYTQWLRAQQRRTESQALPDSVDDYAEYHDALSHSPSQVSFEEWQGSCHDHVVRRARRCDPVYGHEPPKRLKISDLLLLDAYAASAGPRVLESPRAVNSRTTTSPYRPRSVFVRRLARLTRDQTS